MIIFELRFTYQGHYLSKGSMRLTVKSILIVMAVLCCACAKDKKPEGVLDKAQMTAFLTEIYLAEARVSSTVFIRDSAMHVFQPYEKLLLQRKGIADSVLKNSYQYYLEHPDEMQDIMAAVIDSLSLREQAGILKAM